jgi:DNA-binding NarL/FixJ family response regulator
MYRVLLVDDHQIVRAGIRAILEDRYVSIAVAEASNGEAALAALVNPFDAVVLDLAMPGRGGIDLLVEIKHRFPKLPVLIVSMYAEDQFAVRALRAGASGYLTKNAAPTDLITAFERVIRGHRYISDAVAARLADQLGGVSETPHDRLSDREFEVLRGIASGKTVGAIAEVMCLSIKTVSTYRTRLLEKMGMETNAELTRYAIENGLV